MPISKEDDSNDDRFIFTHSGKRAGPNYAAPPLEDIAVSLGRLCRFAGHGRCWFPVILHSFVVCDLVSKEYKGVAILHDASESIINDTPSPFKNPETKKLEDILLERIFLSYLGHGLDKKSDAWKLVKLADSESFLGEVWTVGNAALRDLYPDRSKTAERLVKKYLKKYPVMECLSSEGTAVMDFIRRVKDYQ